MCAGCDRTNEEKLDTIYNPKVVYSAIPQKYEIAGITVTGAPNYEDYVLIGYSGLEVGQVIEIPGNAITEAAKNFGGKVCFPMS